MSSIKVVFGGGLFSGNWPAYHDEESVKRILELLKREGIKEIDTAQIYGDSELLLGAVSAGNDFIIDTKVPGGWIPGSATKETVINDIKASIKRLNVEKVDILYIHAPDSTVPIADTLIGINEAHKAGLFSRFGLSNFDVNGVEAVYEHCKAHGYILPSVFQGNYSAVARKLETLLFPTLRRLGIAFYVYSALAGGFLTKTKEQIAEGAGRFNDAAAGGIYKRLYSKQSYLEALEEWSDIAKDEGCSKAHLAYRWVAFNSPLKKEYGDAVILGASSLKQLEQTLEGLKAGPLSDDACKRINQVWKSIEHEAPVDNYHENQVGSQ
ncbi:Aldo/keto reductase [Lepidopterella palustris CBS 459.81]|uniref:Aldo/keto reductase n=1 Tax=Lepidopterella palustris CBS 459.81 TaxID=1314670 RepID=A0A8E2J8F8_9PEZI|nr:Aldo/keto reductase [Lepidopterella palustris CBS 459.81]